MLRLAAAAAPRCPAGAALGRRIIARLASTAARRPVLVREFIADSLYHADHGYFVRNASIASPTPIEFTKLFGESDYRRLVAEIYAREGKSWHTPVELFQPWWSRAIGRYIVRRRAAEGHDGPLEIYELLDNLPHDVVVRSVVKRDGQAPRVVLNEARVAEEAPGCFKEVLSPAADPLLLRHLGYLADFPLEPDAPPPYAPLAPLPDPGQPPPTPPSPPLGERVRAALLSVMPPVRRPEPLPPRREWLATGATLLCEVLAEKLPGHHLIAADFDGGFEDALRSPELGGRNAPVVQETREGRSIAHETYLVEKGRADIFFPVDFPRLAHVYRKVTGRPREAVRVGKTAEFMRLHGEPGRTRTRTFYNPLLEDFANTRFFLS
eukprot:tig00020710_g13391.t1